MTFPSFLLKRTLNALIIDSVINTPLGFNYTAQDEVSIITFP